MSLSTLKDYLKKLRLTFFVIAIILASFYSSLAPRTINPAIGVAGAACVTTAVPTTIGVVTQTVTVATAGTYRVWSRLKASSATANSYYFKVDTGCNYNVGDSASSVANTWTWVNYQDGSATTPIDVVLSAGSHTLTYTGKEAEVQLDKVMLLGDMSCVPSGLGDNCATADMIAPTVSITAPTSGASVGGTSGLAATASDAAGISKVEFVIDSIVVGTDMVAPYEYAWNSANVSNGAHTVHAKAVDTAGNTASSSVVGITVNNNLTSTPAGRVSQSGNILTGKVFTSSAAATTGSPLAFMNDQDENTRWISSPADNIAVTVDMGAVYTLNKLSILWAGDTTKNYEVQVADVGTAWTTAALAVTNNTSPQLIDTTTFSGSSTGRYLRIVTKDRWNAAYGNSIWEIGAYGNLASPGGNVVPTNGADLVVTGITWTPPSPVTGNQVIMSATIKNQGTSATPSGITHGVSFIVDGVQVSWSDLDNGSLAVGASRVQTASYGPNIVNYWLASQGSHTATAFVDDVNRIPESNEANNRLSVPLIVSPATPAVVMTAPASGASIPVGSVTTVSANATSNVGISKVEFYQNNVLLGTDTVSPYSVSWNTISASAGVASLTAKAYDTAGNVMTSAVVSVTLANAISTLPGDANGDSRVNALDLSVLLSRDGQNYPAGDFNGDGTVGAADLAILLSKWTW